MLHEAFGKYSLDQVGFYIACISQGWLNVTSRWAFRVTKQKIWKSIWTPEGRPSTCDWNQLWSLSGDLHHNLSMHCVVMKIVSWRGLLCSLGDYFKGNGDQIWKNIWNIFISLRLYYYCFIFFNVIWKLSGTTLLCYNP